MLSSVYSFLDWDGWSGERVVLRPDSTIPVARAAREAGVEQPARLYYVQNVFRFHASEDREEWQCGVEFLGAPARLGDLEVIALACETFDALGLRPVVRLSHVGVARALVEALGPADAVEARALTDQVVEGGLGVARHLAEERPAVAAFLEVALQQGDAALLDNLAAIAGDALADVQPALRELADVARALSAAGRDTVVDLGMPLDFEYYNGVVFEFTSGE
jgi:histidyl-tRNA synthetase